MTLFFSRRQFFAASSLVAATISATSSFGKNLLNGPALREISPNLATSNELFKISLAQWSLHRTLKSGKLDNLDFPETTKNEFGIDAVEYVNQFFKDKAKDETYLGELKQRCADNGVTSVLIMVDGEGQLGDADSAKRKSAAENHFQWVDAAKFLGCHSIRVNAGSTGSYEEQSKLATDGLHQVCQYALPLGINVIVENHGGLSSNGQWLARVIRNVGMENCGTLPDFGNFRINGDTMYDRYLGVAALMPFAKAVSAKSHDFDENGNETQTDFLKMMQIVMDAGYHGYVGVEYEGSKLDEYAGIRATKKLLESCRDQLAK
jgi:sugar phosphate isomerase/epimerase